MPVNKDAMARYRIIDRMLADPHKDYTTKDIEKAVAHECPKVTTRMIQKDIKALEEAPFNKKVLRGKGGRGTVRYEDQSNPLFYQELTADEEDILREALGSLGQFEGLDNFKWLENLKKRLDMTTEKKERPVISFARNNVLQISENILGHLYSAISRKKVIRFGYRKFQDAGQPYTQVTVHPYQLRQYNNRWFLFGLNEEKGTIYNAALDRIENIEQVNKEYISTDIDFEHYFDDVIGVSFSGDKKEPIRLKFSEHRFPYVMTKALHPSQRLVDVDNRTIEINVIPNNELEALILSFGLDVEVLSPIEYRKQIQEVIRESYDKYFPVQVERTGQD